MTVDSLTFSQLTIRNSVFQSITDVSLPATNNNLGWFFFLEDCPRWIISNSTFSYADVYLPKYQDSNSFIQIDVEKHLPSVGTIEFWFVIISSSLEFEAVCCLVNSQVSTS